MSLVRRIAAWGAVALAFGVVLVFALPSYRQGEATVAGQTAKNFDMELAGKPAKLSDLRGKVVVLNFWFASCPPCIEEAPALNKLQEHLAPRGGTVLGVSVDEESGTYEQFLKEHNVNFPTWRDPSKKVANEYGTAIFPDTYIIGRDGKILRKIMGPQDWSSPEMLAYLDSVLKPS